jgi:hypothetical protein
MIEHYFRVSMKKLLLVAEAMHEELLMVRLGAAFTYLDISYRNLEGGIRTLSGGKD